MTVALTIPTPFHPYLTSPIGALTDYHLALFGSLPFSFTPFGAHFLSSPDFKICHFTCSLARTFHVVTSLPPRQSQTCANPIPCSPQNHPTVQVGATNSPMLSTLGWMCLSNCFTCHCRIPLLSSGRDVHVTTPLSPFSRLFPYSKCTPLCPFGFPSQAQIKSLFKSHLLLSNIFVKNE